MMRLTRPASPTRPAAASTLVALAALVLIPAGASHEALVETKRYVASNAFLVLNECEEDVGIGGARFCGAEDHASWTVRVTVQDKDGRPAPAIFGFRDEFGTALHGDQFLCGVGAREVPEGAHALNVYVGSIWIPYGIATTGSGCPLEESFEGTITVEWLAAA